jgi:hypothetical protein
MATVNYFPPPVRKQRYSPNMTEKELEDSGWELWWIILRTYDWISSETKTCIDKLREILSDLYPTVKEAQPDRYFQCRHQADELEDELSSLLAIERQKYEEIFSARETFREMMTAIILLRYSVYCHRKVLVI